MIPRESISAFLAHIKFMDIFMAFALATLPFVCACRRRSHFWLRVAGVLVLARVLSLAFAYTYGGSLALEAVDSAVLITLLIAGLMFCYAEGVWNILFYFGSGFMTWYITDRLFLIIASLCRLNRVLRPYFIEDTIPHILLYVGCFTVVYVFIFFTVGRKMRQLGGSEIPMQNTLLLILLVIILTPIFYFESQVIANYDLFFYNMLNLGEIFFYVSMLALQVLMLASARERTEFRVRQMLWRKEEQQFRLVKENIEALNIQCHDLKHQVRHLRETGQVDPAYLDGLERSISIYNSAVRTGNETLDVVLTDKRLHCATHGIQFTCAVEGDRMGFMEVMDIFSLFGNMLDNAIECEAALTPEARFIHLSVRAVNQMLHIHAENRFEGELEMRDGVPVTTKADRAYHGYGMLSIRRIVEKYGGSFVVSTGDELFQLDIMLPIPSRAMHEAGAAKAQMPPAD